MDAPCMAFSYLCISYGRAGLLSTLAEEVRELAQIYTGRKWPSQNLNPGSPTAEHSLHQIVFLNSQAIYAKSNMQILGPSCALPVSCEIHPHRSSPVIPH